MHVQGVIECHDGTAWTCVDDLPYVPPDACQPVFGVPTAGRVSVRRYRSRETEVTAPNPVGQLPSLRASISRHCDGPRDS
ncbi:MAG: hypothetical protein ACI8XM_001468 [Haloarculaceae archaeon]|jgi:hypothetical protein